MSRNTRKIKSPDHAALLDLALIDPGEYRESPPVRELGRVMEMNR